MKADFTEQELRRQIIANHANCPTCHPELMGKRDYVRAATWGTVLAGSLLFWGWVIGQLPGWLS